jgi:hypothetical protein
MSAVMRVCSDVYVVFGAVEIEPPCTKTGVAAALLQGRNVACAQPILASNTTTSLKTNRTMFSMPAISFVASLFSMNPVQLNMSSNFAPSTLD